MAAAATIALSDKEDAATEKAVEDGLIAFNDAAAGPHDYRPSTLSARRAGGAEAVAGRPGR